MLAPTRDRWSRLNVYLHWLIVALVVVQYIDHEWMVQMWDGEQQGSPVSQGIAYGGWLHIIAGSLILGAAFLRLIDRFWSGRPPHPDQVPNWSTWVAKITHFLIYAILLLMPSLGLLAWFTGDDTIAHYHTFFWTPLLILVALHIAGALMQHFYYRTDVLRRMA